MLSQLLSNAFFSAKFRAEYGKGKDASAVVSPAKKKETKETVSRLKSVEKPSTKSPVDKIVEDECMAIIRGLGGVCSGQKYKVSLHDLSLWAPHRRLRKDSYGKVVKHFKENWNIDLHITSSRDKEDRSDE